MRMRHYPFLLAAFTLLFAPAVTQAQGTLADYERANNLRKNIDSLDITLPGAANWIGGTDRFWYRRTVKGGHEFVIASASTGMKQPAFDHAKLAASLSKATSEEFKPLALPFQMFTFSDDPRHIQFTAAGSRWSADITSYVCEKLGPDGGFPRRAGPPRERRQDETPRISPDGHREAFIQNYNIYVRYKGGKAAAALSYDGSEGNYYLLQSIAWSPDSKKLAAYRIHPGYHRKIQYIESSPADQLQPKTFQIEYEKPGDELDLQQPVLFDLDRNKQYRIGNSLFPNPYRLSPIEWRKDSRAFTFEYNQRGHQVYRVLEADAESGRVIPVISEETSTFFCYSSKKFRHDLNDGREVVWMSERDGWNHLYVVDGANGQVKNQITKGQWVVRGVDKVDEQNRQIYFHASGMYPGKDPYFVHYYRIGIDGRGLVALTQADANHFVSFSKDMKHYVDTYSRVDLPPVSELRLTEDRALASVIEDSNIDALKNSGWRAPEVFTATGRDGKTDIWGVVFRPTKFDPAKKYPVIEYIYAGPHDSFVPKSFSAYSPLQALAELGFIVVQIDGMGTSNRSKAFHDVCWKDLADAGFPDRILWHKAFAAKNAYYDISRVGIYGHSAGAQNALGALLFHPEFYKVAVASCGCHDNRMDKIWWNEQWMGWPLGPEYIACSNAENAGKLKGKLLLSFGELDNNVDPASTMQVVNALIKAKKVFDFIMLPGEGHSWGGAYGERKRYDFFVHHLLGVEPPDWNQ